MRSLCMRQQVSRTITVLAENVTAWLVPGSKQVESQIIEEGLKEIFNDA